MDAAIIIVGIILAGAVILAYWVLRIFIIKLSTAMGWRSRREKSVPKTASRREEKLEELKVSDKRRQSLTSQVLTVLIFFFLLWYLFGGGIEHQAAKDLQKIQDNVAADSVIQYDMVARSGTNIDRCSQAGMAAAAFLQAQDNKNYKKWKSIEKKDCASAGVYR